jgi:CHAD domain-containing protein
MAPARSPSPEPAALAAEVERRLDATLRQLDRVVANVRPAASALHRLHRDLRRLRVGIGLWLRMVPKRTRGDLETYDRRVKRLARLVGGVRDRDVALELLTDSSVPRGARERVRLLRTRARLADDAQVGRELLKVVLRSERDAGLFEGIRSGLRAPPSGRRVRDLEAYLQQTRDRGRRAVREAHRRARQKPSPRRLHRLRIRMRNWRHLSDLSSTIDPARPARASPPLRNLQRRLGRLHDLEIATTLAHPARGTRWARSLQEEERRQRRRIVVQLRSRRSREVVPRAEPLA